MPYRVSRRGRKYSVVNKNTGRTVAGGTHSTKKQAQAHATAMNINVRT